MDGAGTPAKATNLVLLGPPGAGKGYPGPPARGAVPAFVQLSTGDLLRAAVAQGTQAGLAARAVMERGDLVSDEIVIAILRDRMACDDCRRGRHLRRLSPHSGSGRGARCAAGRGRWRHHRGDQPRGR